MPGWASTGGRRCAHGGIHGLRLGAGRCRHLLLQGLLAALVLACGAAAVALALGFDTDTVLAGLANVSPAFGRGQAFIVDGRRVVLQLVKNPAGFRQVLHTVDNEHPNAVVVAINDDYAAGRDASWLWDVRFEALGALAARRITSGTRAADMALRLRYDDVTVDDIEPDLEKAVRAAVAGVPPDGRVTVFSTYTAMWALHAILGRIGCAER